MEDAGHLLSDYQREGDFRSGYAFVPFWGRDLYIWLHCYEPEPTPRQVRVLREVLKYPDDLRGPFERALFDHYRAKVYGSAVHFLGGRDVTEERAPKLSQPSQVWDLLSDEQLWIDPMSDEGSAIEFKLTFECSWDPEHGLGVRYRDWEIVGFSGSAD